jgi:hypothetical protein
MSKHKFLGNFFTRRYGQITGVLKEILEQYAAFTGLKVNFHKSSRSPINLFQEEAESPA